MVDISDKPDTSRIAIASGRISMEPSTLEIVSKGDAKKGDVLAVARLSGIMAAKQTDNLIPLCHRIPISSIELSFELIPEESSIKINSRVTSHGKTGVEMEALTAVSVSALTIYDMLKSIDRGMHIGDIHLESKSGGKSGDFVAV